MIFINDLSSDVIVHILSFLSIIDSVGIIQTSKRFLYLCEYLQNEILGTELAASSTCSLNDSSSKNTCSKVIRHALSQIRVRPSVAFVFHTNKIDVSEMKCELQKFLPEETALLAASSDDNGIQANCGGVVESDSHFSILLGKLHRSKIISFSATSSTTNIENLFPSEEDGYWKVFIVHILPKNANSKNFLSKLQKKFPTSTIVGGLCSESHMKVECENEFEKLTTRQLRKLLFDSVHQNFDIFEKKELISMAKKILSTYKINRFDEGVVGLAIGGDVPIHTVVSRGVESVTDGNFIAKEVTYLQPPDELYPYEGINLRPINIIRSIQNQATLEEFTPMQLLSRLLGHFDYVGFKNHYDRFELQHCHRNMFVGENLAIFVDDDSSLSSGTQIDFFQLNKLACIRDLNQTFTRLQHSLHHETPIGAIMFSCNGRGPEPGHFFDSAMTDAKIFHNFFPNIPCLGYYSCGEIGPKAMVGGYQEGSVSIQSFTVVFSVFVVPEKNRDMADIRNAENFSEYFERKFKRS